MNRYINLAPTHKAINYTNSTGQQETLSAVILTDKNVMIANKNIIDNNYRWLYLLEGRGEMINDQTGQKYELTPGSLFLRRPQVSHSVSRDFSIPWKEFCILMSPGFHQPFTDFGIIDLDIEYCKILPSPQLYELIGAFFESFDSSDNPRIRTGRVLAALQPLLTLLHEKDNLSLNHLNNRSVQQHKIAEYAINKITESFESEPDFKAISEEFGYSYDHLSRIFKKKAGMTMKSYRLRAKMQYAKYLLRHSELTINHISLMLGYTDRFAFSHQYKKFFRISPASDRKNFDKK